MQQYERYATSATIYSIDGQRADIRLGSSSTLLHHIEIVGDPNLLTVGQEAPIRWVERAGSFSPVPQVMASGNAAGDALLNGYPDDVTIENTDYGFTIKDHSIQKSHLAFEISGSTGGGTGGGGGGGGGGGWGILPNGTSQYQTIITGASPFAPGYSGFLLDGTTGGKTVFAVTNTKALTLTSTGDFNMTVPATGTVAMLNQANSFTLINPITTIAESWIGPSTTAGVYFKGGSVGIGTVTPDASYKLTVIGASPSGFGIKGYSLNYYGVYGTSVNHTGVVGHSDAYIGVKGDGYTHGVYGVSDYSMGDGVYGVAPNGYGVFGQSDYYRAVYGISASGVAGYFKSTTGYGLIVESGKVGFGCVAPGAMLDILSTTEQLRLGYDNTHYASFTVGPGGNLTIAPTGDFIFDPAGDDILPNSGYDLNIGSLQKKYLTLFAAELWVETLVAQNTIATIGGRILVGPTTILTSDLAPADTTIYVKHNEMAVGDRAYLEADGKVEFIAIVDGPVGTGPYHYDVTRNLDGSGANQWYAGDAVFNTGTTGDGFLDIYSYRSIKSATQYGPTIVGNVRNSATYNDWTEHWAIGNLNGIYGYGTTTYGVGLGKYSTTTSYLTADATNGIRIMRGAIKRFGVTIDGVLTINDSDGAAVITLDASTGAEITKKLTMPGANSAIAIGATPPTSATVGTGIWIDRTGLYGLNANVQQTYIDSTGQLFAGAGAVWLNINGISLDVPTSYNVKNSIKFYESTTLRSRLYSLRGQSPYDNIFVLRTEAITGEGSATVIASYSPSSDTALTELYANNSLRVAQIDVYCDTTGAKITAGFDTGTVFTLLRTVDGGNVGIGTAATTTSKLSIWQLVSYANNAAAVAAGLTAGDLYRYGDAVGVVHA